MTMDDEPLFPPLPAPVRWYDRWQHGWRGQSLTVAALLLGGIGAGLVIGSLNRPVPAPVSVVADLPPLAPVPIGSEAAVSIPTETGRLGPDAGPDRATPQSTGADPALGIAPSEPVAPPQERAALPPLGAPIALPPAYGGPLPPWRQFAVAAPPSEGRAKIVIVIDDMGIDRARSAQTVALPGPLTLSYLPYGQNLPAQTAEARRHGHELMVHMPMQPSVAMDPGPDALTVALSPEEVQRRVRSNLGKFEGYVGVNNHMGSRFTPWEAGMLPVIAELRARGLLWLDSRTSAKSVGSSLAQKLAVPYVDRDIFLDDDPALDAVRKQLKQLEAVAHRTGKGVAIGHPKDHTITALKEWLPTLAGKGLVLVPISNVVKVPAGQSADLP